MGFSNSFEGGCHCGEITFTFETNKNQEDLVPRTCQCSLCKKHDASYVSDPDGVVNLRFKNKLSVSFYRFGHSTADFITCKKCGVLTMALCEIDEITRAGINTKSMGGFDIFTTMPVKTNFDEETVESRLGRRGHNWTGTVNISEG